MTAKNRNRLTCIIICAVCLLTLVFSGYTPQNKSIDLESVEIIPVYKYGIRVSNGILIDGTTYTPLREFSDATDAEVEVTWDEESQTAYAVAEGLELSATVGEQYITANDRCFYVPMGVMLYEGSVIVPIRELSKIFNVDVIWDEESSSISLDVENVEFIEGGEDYYEEEDLKWLSRLINSESGNQPFDGKLAVGNVVMNRVDDPTCPDTIFDVVFDNKYGVQFSVSTTSAIYAEPNEDSLAAAKICLEGYTILPDECIYFVNPTTGAASWFYQTREYVCTIADHSFYS